MRPSPRRAVEQDGVRVVPRALAAPGLDLATRGEVHGY
jgi:hypothetical protein